MDVLVEEYENLKREYFEIHKTLRGCPTHEQYVRLYLKEQDLLDKMVRARRSE